MNELQKGTPDKVKELRAVGGAEHMFCYTATFIDVVHANC